MKLESHSFKLTHTSANMKHDNMNELFKKKKNYFIH